MKLWNYHLEIVPLVLVGSDLDLGSIETPSFIARAIPLNIDSALW